MSQPPHGNESSAVYLSEDQLLKYGRQAALAIGPAFGHAYCPTTSEEANNFLPHRWVLEAIQSAFLDGQQFALGGMNFRMQQYGIVPPKQEASSPDIAQPTQKSE